MKRRTFLSYSAASAAVFAAPAALRAQDKKFAGVTLNINGFGGDFDRIMTETIAKPLEEKTGLKVVYAPGGSSAAVAKVIAAPGTAPFDVILCDSPSMPELLAANAIEPVTTKEVPNAAKLLPKVREFGDHGLPFTISSMVVTYNTKQVKEPVASYADLSRPDLKGRVAMFNLENTGGLLYLLALAEANGGGVDNIDPAFAALARMKPNITSVTPSTVNLIQLFDQEEALAGALWNGRVYAMQKAGKPMAMVLPKEGVYSLFSYASPVKGTKHREAVLAYLDQAMSDEAIGGLTNFFRYGPTTTVEVAPDIAKDVITYGKDGMERVKTVDWTKVAKQRAAWLERFNKEMR